MINYKPLKIKDLFLMEEGNTFRVYYCKDDNPMYLRFNHTLFTVKHNKNGELGCIEEENNDYIEWYYDQCPDLEDNLLNTSRGYAYFYKES